MKIALITNYWKNSDGGGVKTYIMNLVRKEKSSGFMCSTGSVVMR